MAKKVMCVDDSSTIRMLVEKTLVPEGFDVAGAENGQVALDNLSTDIDLFLVDDVKRNLIIPGNMLYFHVCYFNICL